jgi:iron complex transport system ATP-binding protein
VITASGVGFAYGARQVLTDVGLQARPGEVLGLVGPNGSGKTTLLRILYGALRPRTGTVRLAGEDLRRLSVREVARRVAVVVQEAPDELPLLVADMVRLGRIPHRSGFARHTAYDDQVVVSALTRVGALHLAQQPFHGLSGGERQRVLIARALAQETDHLLLDEPTNHLAVRYQHEVLNLVRGLAVDGGRAVVVVLHDLNLAATYCDRLVLLHQGRVAASGPPTEVLTPEHLHPIYQVDVRWIELPDGFQLVFRPQSTRPGAVPVTADGRTVP